MGSLEGLEYFKGIKFKASPLKRHLRLNYTGHDMKI